MIPLGHREMQSETQIQILDETVYISLCGNANALRKGMNPSLFLLAMGKSM